MHPQNSITQEELSLNSSHSPKGFHLPNQNSTTQKHELSPLVEYAIEKGLDKDAALRLEEYLGGNLTEGKREFIEILCEFNGSYVPEGIAEIVPEDYAFRLLDNLRLRIIDSLAYDGNLSEDEMRALRVLLSLPKDVQRWYIEGEGLSGNTIYYLNFVDGLENESFRRFIFENMLCFADGKLEEIEKEFLLNPDLYLKEIKKYYSEKLEKIPELREQIEELPDYKLNSLRAVEALEDIAFLVEKAEPYEKFEDRFDSKKITPAREVYEGFELMLKGGKVKRGIVPYEVPEYNAQLYILWKLAESNEFKRHDTLVQSIALNEGFPYVIGDSEVKRKVVEDSRKWLKFLRETSEWQKANDLKFYLEDYPLEAKIALCDRLPDKWCFWFGSKRNKWFNELNLPDIGYWSHPINLETYNWYWLNDFENLRKIYPHLNSEIELKEIDSGDFRIIDSKIFFNRRKWKYPFSPELAGTGYLGRKIEYLEKKYGRKEVDKRKVLPVFVFNPDFYIENYVKNKQGIGNCMDYANFITATAKSSGIPAVIIHETVYLDETKKGHHYPCYYDYKNNKWVFNYQQLFWHRTLRYGDISTYKTLINFEKVPINIKKFFVNDYYYEIKGYAKLKENWINGIDSLEIKNILAYEKKIEQQKKREYYSHIELDGIIEFDLLPIYIDEDDSIEPSANISSVYIYKTNNSYYFGIKTLQPPDTKKYMYYIGIDVDEDLKKDYIVNIDSSDVKLYKMIKENPLLIYETRPYIKRDIEFTIPAEYLEEPKAIFAGSYDIKKEKCIDCNPWKFLNE